MDLILLPGNSKSNKEWIEKVEKSLGNLFDKTVIQYYDHWVDESKAGIDIEAELKNLSKTVKGLGEYAVFAKSAGVLLVLKGIDKKIISPKRCIFVGSAINMGRSIGLDLESLAKGLTMPALFIQKEFDPAYSFKDLKKFVEKAKLENYEMVKLPGDDHYYGNMDELVSLISDTG